MSIIKTALVAVSLVAVAAAANAQGREDLNTGIHGESAASVQSYQPAPRYAVTQNARAAYAQAGTVRLQRAYQAQSANPLFDDIHGNTH